MYKNQLQELAQRSCFNLPSYSCIREGPDHAPRFKATVNFNGETFESPSFFSTLRQAEHAAAEVALTTLANQGPSKALASKILDETGVYKNLLQETANRVGLNLPIYTTVRSGPGHVPAFSCTVELAGLTFAGEPAKTKKQAQKNAAMAAWSTLKQLAQRGHSTTASESDTISGEEQEQVIIARFLSSVQPPKPKISSAPQKPLAHVSVDPNHPSPSSLSPVQYTDLVYWNFSTELAMYRLWQQAQLSHHQSSSLQVQVAPPLLPPPLLLARQLLPFIPSVFHPNQLYFPQEHAMGPSTPSFHMSSNSVQVPSVCQPKVVQEIQEEKSEVPCQEKEAKTGETAQVEPSPMVVQYSRASPNPIELRLQNLRVGEPSQCNNNNLRPHQESYHRILKPPYPAAAAAPVRIRNVGPVSSLGHRPQNLASPVQTPLGMRTGGAPFSVRPCVRPGTRSRFMAPAVQIRSVVPVCSAPPPRKIPSSGQEVKSSDQEKKDSEQE